MDRDARRQGRSYIRCHTCRVRRVKCDGARPACNNCVSTHRVCGGYSTWDVSLEPLNTETPRLNVAQRPAAIVPDPGSSSTSTTPPLLQTESISDEARLAFDYFRHYACARYLATGYPILWATCSMFVALQEPAVFYAVVAAGFAQQSVEDTLHTTLARPIDETRKASALRWYSKAISCLNEAMGDAMGRRGSLEPIILSCLNFVVFEVTMGNHVSAMRHARVGRNILDERLRQQQSGSATSTSSSGVSSPSPGAISRESAPGGADDRPSRSVAPAGLGVPLDSLAELRASLETLTDAGQMLREQLIVAAQASVQQTHPTLDATSQFCLSHTRSRTMSIATALQTRLHETLSAFSAWGNRFMSVFRNSHPISRELLFLQIRFFYASSTMVMCRAGSEKVADSLVDEFVRALESAERLLRTEFGWRQQSAAEATEEPVVVELMEKLTLADRACSAAMHQESPYIVPDESSVPPDNARPIGVFGFGILHALFTIACRCRASRPRRKATQLLLNAKRIEAVNSSGTLSMYAEAIIHLEELQTRLVTGRAFGATEFYADEVPEQARFLDVVARPDPERSAYFLLTCTRRTSPEAREIELLQYECSNDGGERRLLRSETVHTGTQDSTAS